MKPLRIVRVSPFAGDAFGGPVAQARAVHRELAARGHDVRVITTDLGIDPAVERDRFVPWHGVPTFFARTRGLRAVPPYLPPRRAAAAIVAALGSADVAAVNVGLSWWGTALARAATRARVPFVYNAEGALDPVRLAQKRWQKVAFVRLCERRVLRRAAALQAVTAHEADCLVALGADRARVHVIPNGVAPAAHDERLRTAGRRRLGVPESARVVLFFGRRDALKGLDLLLAAAAPLLTQLPDLHVVVVGPPGNADRDVARAVAAHALHGQVHLHDSVSGQAKAEVLAAADVFALTSRSEGLPNAALEAAAAGLPLLVSDACHLPEVAAFGAGRQCAPRVDAIAPELRALVHDADLRRRCSAGARRMVAERFALAGVVDRLVALYAALAAPRS